SAPGRYVAFRTKDALPANSAVRVTLAPGLPSAEGPLTTTKAAEYEFQTYPPLAMKNQSCKGDWRCEPGSHLTMYFNNQLDTASFDPASVKVTPSLGKLGEDYHVEVAHQQVTIRGETRPRTEYEVTLPGSLRDVHGQSLGRALELEF